MVDSGYGPKPTNKIIVAGQPLTQILEVESASSMYPGRLVKKGTGDHDAVVGTASIENIGWLGYEDTIKKHRPATVDTIYLINAQAAVHSGGGFVIVASLVGTAAAITKGQLLKGVAGGELTGGSAGTDHIVAIAEESTTLDASSQDIMVRSLI